MPGVVAKVALKVGGGLAIGVRKLVPGRGKMLSSPGSSKTVAFLPPIHLPGFARRVRSVRPRPPCRK